MLARELYSPWGNHDLPPFACDHTSQSQPLMLGLTGLRNVGKSTVATMLEAEYGFERVHAFGFGKQAAQSWFDAIGGDGWEMVYGSLKDVPSSHLPGNVSPRFFLEKFGHFMGSTLGVEWTLGMEISAVRRQDPGVPIVVESLVYEAPWFKRQGGKVLRLERPGHEGPAGVESDKVQALIKADATISAADVRDLKAQARAIIDDWLT